MICNAIRNSGHNFDLVEYMLSSLLHFMHSPTGHSRFDLTTGAHSTLVPAGQTDDARLTWGIPRTDDVSGYMI